MIAQELNFVKNHFEKAGQTWFLKIKMPPEPLPPKLPDVPGYLPPQLFNGNELLLRTDKPQEFHFNGIRPELDGFASRQMDLQNAAAPGLLRHRRS